MRTVDRIAPVPGNSGKQFHLPDVLVAAMGDQLQRKTGLDIRKTRATSQLKNLPFAQKVKALEDVFELHEDVSEHSILLVDDLYESGATIWALAKFLKEKGASAVYGLACLKSWSDTNNL